MNILFMGRKVLQVLSVVSLFVLPAFPAHAQVSSDASQVFKQTLETYKTAKSFSCDGDFFSQDDGKPPLKDRRTVKILFSRPDRFRLDWTETQAGGEVIKNSIFTREKGLFFYWAVFDKYKKVDSIENVIGECAGISRTLSFMIPSLLLGQSGYFNFASLKKEADPDVDGRKSFRLTGTTQDKRSYDFLIDQVNHVIVQIKEKNVIRSSAVEDARKELEKTNPDLAKQLPHVPPQPDRNMDTLITFKNIQLDGNLKDADFLFDVPKTAALVETIP